MNADTRTLLKVKLEDAVAAEDIFTTLMGENVEARRKFIEDNALEVVIWIFRPICGRTYSTRRNRTLKTKQLCVAPSAQPGFAASGLSALAG